MSVRWQRIDEQSLLVEALDRNTLFRIDEVIHEKVPSMCIDNIKLDFGNNGLPKPGLLEHLWGSLGFVQLGVDPTPYGYSRNEKDSIRLELSFPGNNTKPYMLTTSDFIDNPFPLIRDNVLAVFPPNSPGVNIVCHTYKGTGADHAKFIPAYTMAIDDRNVGLLQTRGPLDVEWILKEALCYIDE